jgi:hypothetical protein
LRTQSIFLSPRGHSNTAHCTGLQSNQENITC